MKKAALLIASLSVLATTTVVAQNKMDHKMVEHNKDQKKLLSPRAYTKSAHVSVSYGQPSMRNRKIFGGLVPYNKIWRTGANEATTITFNKDGEFDHQHVKKGTYTMFTIPTENNWTIILNSKLGQWGAYGYDSTKKYDIVKVQVPVKHTDQPVEKFTIEATDNNLLMKWEKTMVEVPMKF